MVVVRAQPLGDKASLSQVRRQIRADLARRDIDQSDLFDCLVAVTEACTRALVQADAPVSPTVAWEITDSLARFYVRDFTGKEWSRVSHPSRRDDESEEASNYGLDIIRSLMDEVDVAVGPDGTVVSLVKRLATS
jgi:anti-sigma regulatory factor (Ser/Thr protein kinase)